MTNGLMCYLIGSGLFLSSIGVGVGVKIYKNEHSNYILYMRERNAKIREWTNGDANSYNENMSGREKASHIFGVLSRVGRLRDLEDNKEELAKYYKFCELIILNNKKINYDTKLKYISHIRNLISTVHVNYDPDLSFKFLVDEMIKIRKEIKEFMVSHGMKFRRDVVEDYPFYDLNELTIDKINDKINSYDKVFPGREK